MASVWFFLPSLAGGGAERVTLDQCACLLRAGHRVTLVVGTPEGALTDRVPSDLEVLSLDQGRIYRCVLPLRRLVSRRRPDVVLPVMAHTAVATVVALLALRGRPAIVAMIHNTLSIKSSHATRRVDRLLPRLARLSFRAAQSICAVSDGVARDLVDHVGIDRRRVRVVHNPIDYDRLLEQAQGAPDVPLPPGDGPLFVAAGRMVDAKDFDTLLRAFADLPVACRLVVIGEGPLRQGLSRLADDLGIGQRACLPGFSANPSAIFARSHALVLSSRWEGLPTVLLEALAFDLHLVSTDCPSGPREILREGALGSLVPVGDVAALSRAMRAVVALEPPHRSPDELEPYRAAAVERRLAALVSDAASAGGS